MNAPVTEMSIFLHPQFLWKNCETLLVSVHRAMALPQKMCAAARRAPFLPSSLYSLIGREKENKEKQQRKRNFSSFSSSSSERRGREERAKISGSFCSLRANPCSGRRGVTFTPPSPALSTADGRQAAARPPAAERWADAAADAATADAAAATDALQSHPSILVRYS